MPHSQFQRFLLGLLLVLSAFVSASNVVAQDQGQYGKTNPKANRMRGLHILGQVEKILQDNYYDRTFHGIDLKARFKTAEEQIKGQDMNWQIYRTIAQVLIELNDSHTTFLPPDRLYRVEYGFTSMMIGNRCFVVNVRRGSDAEKKGLGAGDEIIAFNGISPTRDSFWVINYLIYGLDPQESLTLKLLTLKNENKEVVVQSKFLSPKERKEERRKRRADEQSKPYRCQEVGQEAVACKLRTFEVEKQVIDSMMKDIGASKKLILDLRGNSGGYVSTEKYLAGRFFENDVIVGTEVIRGTSKQRTVEGSKEKAYKGELVILIDSESASASEVFARTAQLEKRARVVGDTSAGAVMTSVRYGIKTPVYGPSAVVQQPYHVSIMSVSIGDLIMRDGNRLELIGVSPDLPVGPSPLALSNRTDPVLAYAAELVGSPITPEKAGEFYFLLPKSEDALDQDDSEEN